MVRKIALAVALATTAIAAPALAGQPYSPYEGGNCEQPLYGPPAPCHGIPGVTGWVGPKMTYGNWRKGGYDLHPPIGAPRPAYGPRPMYRSGPPAGGGYYLQGGGGGFVSEEEFQYERRTCRDWKMMEGGIKVYVGAPYAC